MEIIIAENSGLCYGVKRALNIARRTRRAVTGPVSTLGDLIHNPRVVADLRACGVRSAAAARDIEGGTVIIRSHGVSPAIYRALARKNLEIVDATCPIVKEIQKLVESLARKNMEVIIVGDREHPEIRGLIGHSRSRGIIVENEAQARELPRRKTRAAVAQSTLDVELFERVVAVLVGRTGELSVHNTICRFTRARQNRRPSSRPGWIPCSSSAAGRAPTRASSTGSRSGSCPGRSSSRPRTRSRRKCSGERERSGSREGHPLPPRPFKKPPRGSRPASNIKSKGRRVFHDKRNQTS